MKTPLRQGQKQLLKLEIDFTLTKFLKTGLSGSVFVFTWDSLFESLFMVFRFGYTVINIFLTLNLCNLISMSFINKNIF